MSEHKEKEDKKALWVPEEVHTEAKVKAAKKRLTIREYITKLILGDKQDEE
jgi:hypothetical protein